MFNVRKGDTVLHQIASDSPGSGMAQSGLNKFFDYCPSDVFLSVRADNLTANKFYVKMNMKLIGKTSWAKGTLLVTYMSNAKEVIQDWKQNKGFHTILKIENGEMMSLINLLHLIEILY